MPPDYDFFSETPQKHAKKLADIIFSNKEPFLLEINAKTGLKDCNLIIPGLILQGNNSFTPAIYGWTSALSGINIFGYINRIS